MNNNTNATDLLGLSTPPTNSSVPSSNANVLVDVLGDLYNSTSNAVGATQNTYNLKKCVDYIYEMLRDFHSCVTHVYYYYSLLSSDSYAKITASYLKTS